ncbi:carbohydrate binding family 9 domain-containing protein [Roseisolibacter agri]|uniref:DUF5916 domain-containing protein n=1 Tax=Roseisolibacter agri TaxID=2014610 RepID=A0AA37Q7J1_9BACT|nr:DUF5916 domain-containing protein [Roseisolibacter agri]GLC23811.1 hypothetical protein rosag_03240 [Roseisolibacter agri]
MAPSRARRLGLHAFAVLALLAGGALHAQPSVRFASGALRLDGALTEPAWATADSIADFTQRDPAEGAPVSERTVVRFVGTPDGLWIGVWAYDREPGGIRRAQLRRDADFTTDDSFTLMLSPTADRRTGFLFGVNPNGALYDAEILTFEGEAREWDGIWDARARVTPDGWQAEMLIPWQTLRYRAAGEPGADAWDVNLRRFIRRKNETALWRAWRRSEGIRFLERAGTLRGFASAPTALPGGLPRRAVAELRPYVAATERLADRRYATDGSVNTIGGASLRGDAGLDAKLAPSPTLTLDLTANADFAQAEVDRQVVNLTRFPLFFPEQRPFFTEGAGIFEFGRRQETQLFYSRRIGLGPGGLPVPLYAGARLTGRVGGQQVGVLATRTGGDAPATDVVTRVKRDVLGRGYVGAMATLRDPSGRSGQAQGRGLAGGVDFNLPYIVRGQNLVFLGNVAADGGAAAGDPTFARFVIDYPNDHADIVARFDRVGAGFVPALGFVQQAGVMRYSGNTAITPRPQALGPLAAPLRALGVRRLLFNALGWNYVRALGGSDQRGLSNARFTVTPLGAELESGDEFELSVVRTYDVPGEAFELFPGADVPAGRYRWDRVELDVTTSGARPLVADVTASVGDFYAGRSWEVEGALRARFQPHVLASVEYGRTGIRLPADTGDVGAVPLRFAAQFARARVDVAASPRLNTTLFAQWDNESERVALNARVRWTSSPGSDAYLVWNSAWPSDLPGGLSGVPWRRPTGGALVAKYVRYLRL